MKCSKKCVNFVIRNCRYFSVVYVFILLSAFTAGISCRILASESVGTVYSDSKGINSWWVYPLAVDYNNYSYISYTTEEGFSGIIKKDNDTGSVERVNLIKTITVDDHNAGAVEILRDGRILYAFSDHVKTKYITIFISKKPEDITSWKTKRIRTDGRCTYAQIVKCGKEYLLFTRLLYKSGEKKDHDRDVIWAWAVSRSRDGVSWTRFVNIIHGFTAQYYLKAMAVKDSGLIRLVTYSNPNDDSNEIRLCFFDPAKNIVEDASGKVIYRLSPDGAGCPCTAYGIIVPKVKKTLRLYDVGYSRKDRTILAYSEFKNKTKSNYKIMVHKNKKTKIYKVRESGKAFYNNSKYFGGMIISEKDPRIVYLAREKNGFWYIEKWKLIHSKYKRLKIIMKTKNVVAIRPFLKKYGEEYVSWSQGYYNENDYRDFLTYINQ